MTTDRKERAGALALLRVLFPETWATRSNALEHVIAYGDARAAQEREALMSALREPSGSMWQAGTRAVTIAMQDGLHYHNAAFDCWNAMLALAIRERETEGGTS